MMGRNISKWFEDVISNGKLIDSSFAQSSTINYRLSMAVNAGLVNLKIIEKRTTILEIYYLSPSLT